MFNNTLTAEAAMRLVEELDRYPVGTVYETTKKDKNGNTIPNGYGIAFYYEDTNGKKCRKSFTGRPTKEELYSMRKAFLTDIFYQKEALKEKEKNINMLKKVLPESLLKEDTICTKTVNEAVDGYLALHKSQVKYVTHENERYMAKHIKTWLGNKRICDLTGYDYQELLNHVAQGKNGKRASKKTVTNVKGCFARVIRFCKKNGWITSETRDDILEDVTMPVTARKDNNKKYAPLEEMGVILNTLKDNRKYYLIIKILLLTGMRGQEIFALERADLLPEQGLIHVRQALEEQEKKKKSDRKFEVGQTKNEQSERYVPAIPEVFRYFKELEGLQVKNEWREKAYRKGNGNMVVIDSNGNIVDKRAFNRNLGLYLKRRGCEKILTLHMPRHCYTTYLKLLGADVENVELSLGHEVNGVRGCYLAGLVPDYIKLLFPKIKEMAEEIQKAEGVVSEV